MCVCQPRRGGIRRAPPAACPWTARAPPDAMATSATVLAIVRAARPVFRQRADALAFALHAALLAEGFVLVAAGAAAEDEPSADAALHEAGPDGWNASADEYAFRYRQESAGGGTVVLKALSASGKLFVDAAGAATAAAAAHLELRRVPPPSSLPARRERAPTDAFPRNSVDEYTTDKLGSGYADVYSNLEGLLARVRASLLPTLKPEAARRTEAAGQARREREPEPAYEGGYGGGGRYAPAAGCSLSIVRRLRAALKLALPRAEAGSLSARLDTSAAWAIKTGFRLACRSYRRWGL